MWSFSESHNLIIKRKQDCEIYRLLSLSLSLIYSLKPLFNLLPSINEIVSHPTAILPADTIAMVTWIPVFKEHMWQQFGNLNVSVCCT